MSSNLLVRSFAGDLSIRSDGRTITGLAVPFGVPARVSDGGPSYLEVWQRGAFTKTIAQRGHLVKLLVMHDRQTMPIGRATKLTETADGLVGEFRVSDVPGGNDALTLVRDGALDGLSIGFAPLRQSTRGDTVTRIEARLDEVSLVSFPAFDSARVLAVRSADYPRLSIARRRLDLARLSAKDHR